MSNNRFGCRRYVRRWGCCFTHKKSRLLYAVFNLDEAGAKVLVFVAILELPAGVSYAALDARAAVELARILVSCDCTQYESFVVVPAKGSYLLTSTQV